jgi:hypothetical protein
MDVLPSRSAARGFRLARRPRAGAEPPPVESPPVPPPARPGDRPRSAATDGAAGATGVEGVESVRERERTRSALASQALSELSALSSYSPTVRDGGSTAALARRTPVPPVPVDAPDDGVTDAEEPARPQRSPEEVRTMLAGFQDGVSRARTPLPSRPPRGQETT